MIGHSVCWPRDRAALRLDPRDGRYPDALNDRGPRVPGALYAQEPVAVFETLSKSTGWIDQSLKLCDYDATPTIRTYILISQDKKRPMAYTRDGAGQLIQTALHIWPAVGFQTISISVSPRTNAEIICRSAASNHVSNSDRRVLRSLIQTTAGPIPIRA